MSPTPNSRFFRDEPNTATPPPALLRRKTDFRDSSDLKLEDKDKDHNSALDVGSPYGTLKRSATNPLGANSSGQGSPWAAPPSQSTGFSTMGGAFGSFNIGTITPKTSSDKKASFGSLRGESRFKGLLSKGSSEDVGSIGKDKSSAGLERLPETENDASRQFPGKMVQNRANRSDTNPFEEARSGSSALGGEHMGTPTSGIGQFGLSAYGMPSSSMMSTAQPPASRHEPMSPTNTNPYQSPHGDKVVDQEDVDTDGSDIHAHLPNLNELQEDSAPPSFGSFQRVSAVEGPAGDRSQTSSVGASRGFPSLGGLGGLSSLNSSGGWPVSAAGGTPTRERSAFSTGFGDPIFGSMADLQSPSLATLGGTGFFGPHTGLPSSTPTSNRPSKLGSLFPTAMQDQMRVDQSRQELTGNDNAPKSQGPSSPERAPGMNISASQVPFSLAPGTPTGQTGMDMSFQLPHNGNQTTTPGQLPTSQQRQMVMPDRMRWIYRDPQGNMQGPWSGLEMHDWFKAGFFTADLQVKKMEDIEYEPLAQLVRRIGNSREPFLVPQIGVPHGTPAHGGHWGTPGPNGGVQPPFPSSFPSFGTTLTAEQQNALERRKQEEQYLMARQKEHLAQQQAMMKQIQVPPGSGTAPAAPAPHPLQHHPSAHSLHSQPSFGSITSPGGFQPPPMQAPIQPPQSQAMPGYFEPPVRQSTMPNLTSQIPQSGAVGPDEMPGMMDRLNINRSVQFPFGTAENSLHSQQVAAMLQDRARLQQEQEQFNNSKEADSIFDQQAREERLRQFHAYRGSSEEDVNIRRSDGLPTHPAGLPSTNESAQDQQQAGEELEQEVQIQILEQTLQTQQSMEPLSLSQQVQKAASQRQQEQAHEDDSGWKGWKVNNGLPLPFPPPMPSASPLPAPAAQRRQNVADTLAEGSRSQTQTPAEAASTSVAPWAKDVNEAPKGPSLKEIQEAEARQAAKLEEAAAAARRALAEQERANQPPPPAPGLPSTANWASASSTTPTPSAGPAWGKAVKSQTAAPTTPKKTLAQIQKEEEARKQRQQASAASAASAAATAQAAMVSSPAANAAKRYADLASKATPQTPTPQTPAAAGGAWTTVGAGGKTKAIPPAPVVVTSTTPVSAAAKPTRSVSAVTRPPTMSTGTATNPNRAGEEFAKWAKIALGRGLNNSINGKTQFNINTW